MSPGNELDCGDKLNRAKPITCYVTVLSRLLSQLNRIVEQNQQIPVVNRLLVSLTSRQYQPYLSNALFFRSQVLPLAFAPKVSLLTV